MFNKDNVFIAVNEEDSSIIQQYIIREIKKVLDKYKSITTEEIRNVEKLINNKDLSDYLNNFIETDINFKIASNLLLTDILSYFRQKYNNN